MKVVGLTGSTGVLGKRIAALLQGRRETKLVHFKGDLRSETDLRAWVERYALETIILSAAVVPLDKASKFPADTYEINAFSNLKLAYLMQARYDYKFRVCYVSSSHVYAPDELALTENSPLEPKSVYGRSKLLGEQLLQGAAKTFDFELLIMRVFSFYSDDQHESHLYPTLLRKLANHPHSRIAFKLANWNDIRDFSPADEIALKVTNLATSNLTGIINVGSGIATTVGGFASKIYGSALNFQKSDASMNPTKVVADVSRFENWNGEDNNAKSSQNS